MPLEDPRSTRRLTRANASVAPAESGETPFVTLFRHGSLVVEFYQPDQVDLQQPHTRDEIYVIASGSGTFFNGLERHPVEEGEVLFVAAGVEHRFENFTADFATWVFFYGPEGGEG